MSIYKILLLSILFSQTAIAIDKKTPNRGEIASHALIKSWDRTIFPGGKGLPVGSGTAVSGKKIYTAHCQSCHGFEGTGDSADELAGALHSLTDTPPDKTIGTYWPYATTIFDFTRRSMPLNDPGSLSDNEIYAVTAYLLFINGIIKEDTIIDNKSLAKIKT